MTQRTRTFIVNFHTCSNLHLLILFYHNLEITNLRSITTIASPSLNLSITTIIINYNPALNLMAITTLKITTNLTTATFIATTP